MRIDIQQEYSEYSGEKPASFIVPSSDIPRIPFVAMAQNQNGSFVKKEIPVRYVMLKMA